MTEQTRHTPPVSLDRLKWRCDPAQFSFGTTEDLKEPGDLIGQDRAVDAINLAAGIRQCDFNVFVLGPSGTGRFRAVKELLKSHAQSLPAPDDLVYVNNFAAPHKPIALRLPPKTAQALKSEIEDLVDDLGIDIPNLFETDEYQATRRAIDEEFSEKQEAAMSEFAEKARQQNVALLRTPMGFMLAATKDGEVVKKEEFSTLPEKEQAEIEKKIVALQEELSEILRNVPRLERERRHRIEATNAEMTGQIVSARVDETVRKFKEIEAIQDFLKAVRDDMISNAEMFLATTQQNDNGPFPDEVRKAHRAPWFRRYMVNVIVSQEPDEEGHAPVVFEHLPTLDRLTGRIEHVSQMGALVTDFTMIKPGALHRANGGYLVLDARRLLAEPMAWTALKQCLQNRSITIISMAERLSLVSTTSLEPDPIPLDVRVVLIGDRLLYALLVTLDPEFSELFKIEADFEEDINLSPETSDQFVRLIGARARKNNLRPVDAGGVARLLDETTRRTGDRQKMSLHLGDIDDLLSEADHYASLDGQNRIRADDIRKAVEEKQRRSARIKERMREAVARKTILIDTDGEAVGQVNGLSVIGLGSFRFGRPSRITARTRLGAGKLVDIEREVELGGPLHSKGVLILSNYLATKYALDVPYSLHASLTFEQSYGGVDGDSASAAELFALISSLSEVPIQQGFAVTGSVNQGGLVQAIGGVNEKIEGFFETCVDQGLTGRQGVVIPASNLDHVMLRDDVFEAVEQGKFRIFAVETIDQGIEILTGREAGERRSDGTFPPGSINALVEDKLVSFAEKRREFARKDGEETDGKR
ncbi:Lon protease family protein [Ruegeria marisrubri]|uniref:Lon protease family protein n=1 Tax=Ruegeria marisrubri TaxID=1685379 RepID=UPI000AD2ABE1|nr:ATP-binding protein [Ruegeria marisrubri]